MTDLLAGIAITTVGTLIQTVAGFGFALTAVPLLSLIVGPHDGVVVISILSWLNVALLATRLRRSIDWPRLGRFLAGAAVGLPVGLTVFLVVSAAGLQLGVALVTLGGALGIARGYRVRSTRPTRDVLVGASAGVLGTSTGMSGPPLVIYLQALGLEPLAFRATLTTYFAISGGTGLIMFAASGALGAQELWLATLSSPGLLIGGILGAQLAPRIPEQGFRTLVLVLITAAAVANGVVSLLPH